MDSESDVDKDGLGSDVSGRVSGNTISGGTIVGTNPTHVAVIGGTNAGYIASTFDSDLHRGQSALVKEIANLKREVDALKELANSGGDISSEIDSIETRVEKVSEQGESLTAPVLIPNVDDMSVKLVPSSSLERLNEYQSDLNWIFLFLGLFGGGVISLVVSLVLSNIFSSVSMFMLLGIITGCLFFAAWTIRGRSKKVRESMFSREKADEDG